MGKEKTKKGNINSSVKIKILYTYRCIETVTKWCPRSEEYTHISIKPSRRICVCV